jgi:hypothetical protein
MVWQRLQSCAKAPPSVVVAADEEGDQGDEDQGDDGVADGHPLLDNSS